MPWKEQRVVHDCWEVIAVVIRAVWMIFELSGRGDTVQASEGGGARRDEGRQLVLGSGDTQQRKQQRYPPFVL